MFLFLIFIVKLLNLLNYYSNKRKIIKNYIIDKL